MTCVWLAGRGRDETLGIFTGPELARGACQDVADEYYGPGQTPPLAWRGDDMSSSADYHHPAGGMQVFTIGMYELDKAVA